MFTIPGAMAYADWTLLLLRLVLALVFGTSGFNHLRHSKERAASIGMSVPFTIFLGAAECAGTMGLATGVLAPWAAVGLILLMLGAIYKKAWCGRQASGARSLGLELRGADRLDEPGDCDHGAREVQLVARNKQRSFSVVNSQLSGV